MTEVLYILLAISGAVTVSYSGVAMRGSIYPTEFGFALLFFCSGVLQLTVALGSLFGSF